MDLQEFVDTQSEKLFEEIKNAVGSEWDRIREQHEDTVKLVAKYLTEYTFKSYAGKDVSLHLQVLRACVKEYTAIGSIEAQSVLKAIASVVKEFAAELASTMLRAGIDAGIDALKESLN